MLRNDAVFPFPIGGPIDEFAAQIMRVDVRQTTPRNLRTTSSAESVEKLSNTYIKTINDKL